VAEKQGEKLVYVLEATKAINSNENTGLGRKNGEFMYRLFKRYSKVEEFHRKLCSKSSEKYLPPIPPKNIINQRSEVIERRTINFELFFQTVMLHGCYLRDPLTLNFFKLGQDSKEEEKTEQHKFYYCGNKAGFLLDIAYETTTLQILSTIQTQWNIRDINTYRVCFVSEKYGEKILDHYECPIQVIQNYEAEWKGSSFVRNWVGVGKRIKNKPRSYILRYFNSKNKYIFYVRRVIFTPDDYELNFRIPFEELKRRYYQGVFDLNVENIV